MSAARDRLVRALAIGGLIGMVGDVSLPFVIAAFQPGYQHLTQYMSELGVPGKSGAAVMSGWWIVSGTLTMGFGVGLHLGTGGATSKLGWLGPALIVVYGLLVGVGSGVFPCDEGCMGSNTSGQLHDMLNAIGGVAQLVAPLACWMRWRRVEHWWGFRGWTLAGQALLLVTFLLFVTFAERSHAWGVVTDKGLYQRLFQATFYAWLSVIVARLVAAPRRLQP